MSYAEAETLSTAPCPRLLRLSVFPLQAGCRVRLCSPVQWSWEAWAVSRLTAQTAALQPFLFLDLNTINYPCAHALAPSSLTEAQTALRTLMRDASGFGVIIVCLFFACYFLLIGIHILPYTFLIACVSPGGNAACA